MVGRFAAIGGADGKNKAFKQRPFLVAHKVSGKMASIADTSSKHA